MKHRILIVEDNILLAGQQKKWFEKYGYEAETTIDEPGARQLLKKEPFDLVLSDVRLPEGDGISLLEWMQRERIDVPFIIMTGYASVPDAVRAIKMGAKDYLAKPVQMDELQSLIKDILRPRSVIYGKDKEILSRNSHQMKSVENLARTVAPFDISVLILGPSGAGKESIAQRIHYSSERREKPFLAVNCSVIPKELAPSFFFGHVKGAFTGAAANREGFFETARGGTLFLDEVGNLSVEVQSMLLRTLQEGTYIPIGSNREKYADVRIVSATNENLQLAIKERRFREDLYHRLGEFEIVLPALHECPEDILPLAEHFRERFSKELNRQTDGFSQEAEQLLLSYGWPGNVRELQNKVKRAVLLSKQSVIEAGCLNIKVEDEEEEIFLFPENETQEKLSIVRALKICTGNRKRTAEMLHIDPSTLYRKMKKYGLNNK
ncbi:sigma-54 dependent transcriptional regulator [Barnesiella sp. ET7]|uniref:sigma-54-dependent transcriptional regulator n=1 Tax=Barnesiella sp. ET7 TaxID=2972460 RepID=UPI0021AD4531|nr:sigma-54 dependent transcriptional regulator [Barnesiella sp. ET7]MCR8912380.1 sigma-54 dependent transcriptional regulator [Barnesiella sp. ET7]